jgi:Flp pilus assembly protein TadG
MREKTHFPPDRSFRTGQGALLACCRTGLKRVRDLGCRGVAVVEFAVMAPVLFMVLFGIIEFGIALNQYLTLTNSVLTGARTFANSRTSTTPYSSTQTAMTTAAPTLTAATLKSGIIINVNGTACSSDGGCATALTANAGNPTTVSATYPCSVTIPFFTWTGACTLSAQTTERIE